MKLFQSVPLLLALALPILPSIAGATTIDFESTGTPGSFNPLDYPIDGFIFNETMDNLDAPAWGLPAAGHGGRFVALNNHGGVGELSRQDGAVFSLSTLNFITWPGIASGHTFVVTGFKDGTEVATASLTATHAWQSITANFSAVDKVTFELQNQGQPTIFVIDDIVVNAVPEPETYAMMLAGLGLVGVAARRRSKA